MIAIAVSAASIGPAEGLADQGTGAICPVLPFTGGAQLTAAFSGIGEPSRTLAYGRRSLIAGRLLDSHRFGLPGETVCIEERPRIPEVPYGFAGTATTHADGGWSFKLPSGPSRSIRVIYGGDPGFIATFLDLGVRAHATLHLSAHHTRPHRRVYFYGRIPGPLPARRVVILRGTVPGARRKFLVKRGRTDAFGHFHMSYAFARVADPTKFVFWTVVPVQDGYPYLLGHSGKRYVRVRPLRRP